MTRIEFSDVDSVCVHFAERGPSRNSFFGKRWLPAFSLAVFSLLTFSMRFARCETPVVVSVGTLLDEMVRYDAMASWPEHPFTLSQASSYDRHRTGPDKPGWFDNNDRSNYLRIEKHGDRTECVLLDTDGPGAIVRFFLTSDGEREGHIRIYLDEAEEPAVTFSSIDLFASDLQVPSPLLLRHPPPLGHGGCTLYLPVPYAQHCKVTLEETNPNRPTGRYYHIDYRTYGKQTSVETFTEQKFAAVRDTLMHVCQQLNQPPSPAAPVVTALGPVLLAPGEGKSVDLPAGAAAVRTLSISVAADASPAVREQALRSIVLIGDFDDQGETIWCPVGDFAGCGAGGREVHGWYRDADGKGTSVCRWTMPYHTHARLSLRNVGTVAATVSLQAACSSWQWDDRSMYLHCNWRQQVAVPSRPFIDWNFVTVTGRGVLMGDVMSVYNPLPAWYGEGNEKIWVDRDEFPSTLGTGTEDYYSASWAPNPVFQTPFNSHPRIDEPRSQGNNVYTRGRLLDAIPFENKLQFDFEIETWRPSTVDYAATTYWYGAPGSRCNIRPMPEEAARPIPTLPAILHYPGAIECESVKILEHSPQTRCEPQSMESFTGKWSGDGQLLIRGHAAGDFADLLIPAPDDHPRRLTLYATAANDYGTLKFEVNGQESVTTLDGFADHPTPLSPIVLGIFSPKDGQFRLRVTLTGANPHSTGARFYAGLDALVLSED